LSALRHLPSFPTRRSSDLAIDADHYLLADFILFMIAKRKALVAEASHIERANAERHDALEKQRAEQREQTVLDIQNVDAASYFEDRKSTRLNSSHVKISYA